GSERGRLARTLEALGTSRRPGNGVALCVGDGDHRVVEGRVDVRDARRDVFAFATTDACGFLGHFIPFIDLFTAVTPAATPAISPTGASRQTQKGWRGLHQPPLSGEPENY